mgnify:CR=1 FL=1
MVYLYIQSYSNIFPILIAELKIKLKNRIHEFHWHGNDENKTRYVANRNVFTVLDCVPTQLFYNVEDVRTSDDALIKVKLMIFYELKDIEQMVRKQILTRKK